MSEAERVVERLEALMLRAKDAHNATVGDDCTIEALMERNAAFDALEQGAVQSLPEVIALIRSLQEEVARKNEALAEIENGFPESDDPAAAASNCAYAARRPAPPTQGGERK